MTKFIKSSTNKDKDIIGQVSNVICHLNDLIHKLAYGGNNNLKEIAFENAKNYFKVLNQNFISKIPRQWIRSYKKKRGIGKDAGKSL